MNNLVIYQNEHNYETINDNIIEYLYQLTKTFDDNETNSDLTGRLECNHCFQDAMEYLVNKYPHLHISAINGTYIRFKDSILGSLLTAKYGDGVGVTTQMASEVSSYDGFLKGNTNITSFDELPLFGITTFSGGGQSFEGCTNLQSINLRNITYIPEYFFKNCTSLISLGETNNISRINKEGFLNCNLTGDLEFLSLIRLDTNAFANNINLTSIKFSADFIGGVVDNYNALPENGFVNCTSLKTIYNYSNINRINSNCFYNCSSLETFDFSNIKYIGGTAFKNCTKLSPDISTLSNIEIMTDNCFSHCSSITGELHLSKLIRTGNSVFEYCTGITSLIIDSPNVNNVGSGVFRYCTGLITADISALSVANLFEGCNSLTTVTLNPNKEISNVYFRYCSSLTTINNSESIISVYYEGFQQCTSLENVNFINLKTLNNNAFNGCSKLKTVNLPLLETADGQGMFSGCTELTSCKFGTNITSLGPSMFSDCTKLTIIGNDNNDLSYITSISRYTFYNCSSLTNITLSTEITSIPECCFYNCNNLTTISNINNVTSIGKYALRNCTNLSLPSNTVLNKLTSIADDAFFNCANLGNNLVNNTLDLGDSITTFGASVFYNCNVNIILRNDELPSGFNNTAFNGFSGNIYVKETTIDAFRAKYSYYSSQFKLISEIE